MQKITKECLECGNTFEKSKTKSLKEFETKVKYCSKTCKDIAIGRIAGARITALNISRKGILKNGSQRWYEINKERMSLENKIKYQQNKDKILARRKELMKIETHEQRQKRLDFHKKYNKKHSDLNKTRGQTNEYKFKMYSFAAKARNYDFQLSFEDFVLLFHGDCIYCGSPEARGIDRVDNSIGYTKTNSESCCEMCNKMKWRWSREEFLIQVDKIYKFNNI